MVAKAIAKNYLRHLRNIWWFRKHPLYEERLKLDLKKMGGEGWAPIEYFQDLSDDYFFWLMANGPKTGLVSEEILPGIAPEHIQRTWTGSHGNTTFKQGFNFYKVVKAASKEYYRPIDRDFNICDFGVGWGRIIRFFLRDVSVQNLIGLDCYPLALKYASESFPRINFQQNDIFPPLPLDDSSQDIIYLYSVFSHLSEDACLKWVEEFARIIKPGGILITTTRSRSFFDHLAKMRKNNVSSKGKYNSTTAVAAFENINEEKIKYDRGEFCFAPTGGGGGLDSGFYGEACIPQKFVQQKWSAFELKEWRLADKEIDQDTIICIKKQ
jgi:SAM-dependent methyltransferase